MDPNAFLWAGPNKLGSGFWIPLCLTGAVGMFYLYRLAAPETMFGRVIRIFLALGYLGLVFSVFLNGLGPYAFYSIVIGSVLLTKQVHDRCVAAGKIKPVEGATFIERVANRIQEERKSNGHAD